ncbi:acyl-CoA thioesterase/BAAT N-terminal domain-containing protein [Streptomyces sp. TR06-5]|uniref:acyl-CoA thioesterase/BAAT N-terminal domain-containing protein n=1 Tax=unclassified Streptomyces TaxID=2593676 RepID=UPI0039A04224
MGDRRRDKRRGQRTAAIACVAVLAVLVSGCNERDGREAHSGRAVIEVDEPSALVDRAIETRITGLGPEEKITVSAGARSPRATWRSRATFRADEDGVVDLTRDKPLDGSYAKADGMGLFWSLKARKKSVGGFLLPPPQEQRTYRVRLTVAGEDGKVRGRRTVTRVRMAENVRHRHLSVEQDGLNGSLYLPPKGSPDAAPVLVVGGSEGGDSGRGKAALLASHGHPALSLCYFGCTGRPEHLAGIELEYFARAARHLLRQDGALPRKLVVMGGSRGSEAAQLLGQHHPELVEDVVAFASSNLIGPALADTREPAWTRHGQSLPPDIPLDRVRGSVLGVAGGSDYLWDAEWLSRGIAKAGRLLVYENAGHFVGGPPYLPEPTPGYRYGGTRAADAAAKADAWPKAMELVRS